MFQKEQTTLRVPWPSLQVMCNCSPVFLSPADGLISGFHGQGKGSVGIFIWKKGQERTTFSFMTTSRHSGSRSVSSPWMFILLEIRGSRKRRKSLNSPWLLFVSSCQICRESLSEKKNLFVPPLRLEQWYDFRGKGTVMMRHNPAGNSVSCSCSARKATQIAAVLSTSWAQGNILLRNCFFKN